MVELKIGAYGESQIAEILIIGRPMINIGYYILLDPIFKN